MSQELPAVTASEIADYVFCKHSWYLRMQGNAVSDGARAQRSAGVAWQNQKDERAFEAVHQTKRAKSALKFAWVALFVLIAILISWKSYSHLQD